MLSSLSHKKTDDGYKRKKLPVTKSASAKVDANPGEMDIDETEGRSIKFFFDQNRTCYLVSNVFRFAV